MGRGSVERELTLRIRVVNPPAGVDFLVQRGRDDLTAPVTASRSALLFEFPVRVGAQPNGAPNFLGPFAQGPPSARFVYVNSGTYAGQRRIVLEPAGQGSSDVDHVGLDRGGATGRSRPPGRVQRDRSRRRADVRNGQARGPRMARRERVSVSPLNQYARTSNRPDQWGGAGTHKREIDPTPFFRTVHRMQRGSQ